MKKILTTLSISFLLLFPSQLFASPSYLTILHFNDFHGHLEENCTKKRCEGGAARIASVIKDIEKENSKKGWKTIVLFGGDAFSGTLISSEFKGEAEFRFFNMIGVDAMAIGNHEFDFTLPILEERIRQAQFPVLSSNIFYKKKNNLLAIPFYVISDSVGPSIGIVGITSRYTPTLTNPLNVSELLFTDHEKSALNYIKDIKNTDIKIALTHMGVDADIKLASKINEFDAVIGGHDHIKPEEYCRKVRQIPVCQTPANGKYIGRLDFAIENKKARLIDYKLIAINEKIKKDAVMDAIVASYAKKVDHKYNIPIGHSVVNFNIERGKETNMGDLIADALKWYANSDIAFINSGGIRSPIKKGPVTIKTITEVLPFDNYVVVLKMTGKKIEETINLSVSQGGTSFLQVSGVSFKIFNGKAYDIKINDIPIERKKNYTVATLDFLANGGSGYTLLKKIGYENTGTLVRDVLMNYISNKKVIDSPKMDRILYQKNSDLHPHKSAFKKAAFTLASGNLAMESFIMA